MSIVKSSVSITRYQIQGEIPDGFWPTVNDRLKRNSFRDIDHTADERSFGWVSAEDMLDPDFISAPPEKGEYLAFSLRLDTRRVQPAVFKKHFQIAIKEYLDSLPEDKRRISKDRRQEIREQVALKLRARSLPIPAVFDVAWNTGSGAVYLFSTNTKVRALFEDCFTVTFELTLEPQTPFFHASRVLGENAVIRLENLESTYFAG